MKESLFKRNQEYSGSIKHIAKTWTQDDSGLFLGSDEIGSTEDIYDPTNPVNDDPRFKIRVVR